MKKLLLYIFSVISIAAVLCAGFVFAEGDTSTSLSVKDFSVSGGTISADGTVTLSDTASTNTEISMTGDFTKKAYKLLGENGGKLKVSFSYDLKYREDAGEVNAVSFAAINGDGANGKTASTTVEKGSSGEISITFAITRIDATKVESLKIKSIILYAEPASVASASPSASPSASATAAASATVTATATATPKPTATPTPTKAPSITYETVKDDYDDSGKITNAPPSIVGDVDVEAIATPVPEATATPETETIVEKASNDPTTGLIILFSVLLLLLIADIAVIIWRKKLGFAGLLNGGVARRRIRDDLRENAPFAFFDDNDDDADFVPAPSIGDDDADFVPAPSIGDDDSGFADSSQQGGDDSGFVPAPTIGNGDAGSSNDNE